MSLRIVLLLRHNDSEQGLGLLASAWRFELLQLLKCSVHLHPYTERKTDDHHHSTKTGDDVDYL